MSRTRSLLSSTVLVALLSFATSVQADVIAYDNLGGLGTLQNYGDSLGLDFIVNNQIQVTQLGAFDNGVPANLIGPDGVSGVTVGIYRVNSNGSGTLVTPQVIFSPSNAGTQINGDAFLPITPTVLGAGHYSVVAFNDGNYNTGGGANGTSTLNSDSGAISFVAPTRCCGGFAFPVGTDGPPANRYDAGTFQFNNTPEPSSFILGGLGLVGLVIAARRRKA